MDPASCISFATIATITCRASSSYYARVADPASSTIFPSQPGLVLLLRHTGTTSDPFDDVCRTVDLDGDLRRSCDELMGKLDPRAYFRSWTTE
jgi:hypothetical protein